jgi:hypothetical protein
MCFPQQIAKILQFFRREWVKSAVFLVPRSDVAHDNSQGFTFFEALSTSALHGVLPLLGEGPRKADGQRRTVDEYSHFFSYF